MIHTIKAIQTVTCVDVKDASPKLTLGMSYQLMGGSYINSNLNNYELPRVDIRINGILERGFYAYRFSAPSNGLKKLKDFEDENY